MASTRETILLALHAVLAAGLAPTRADYRRNDVLPTRIDPCGLVILRDGDPGPPEHTLSPLQYHYDHRAEMEVFVQTGTGREGVMDGLLTAVADALAIDRTLGGLCDWVEAEAPEPVETPVEAGVPFRGAIVPIRLIYTTTDPLK
jgi:hypothetical protein